MKLNDDNAYSHRVSINYHIITLFLGLFHPRRFKVFSE